MRNEFDNLRKSYFKKDQELEEINFSESTTDNKALDIL